MDFFREWQKFNHFLKCNYLVTFVFDRDRSFNSISFFLDKDMDKLTLATVCIVGFVAVFLPAGKHSNFFDNELVACHVLFRIIIIIIIIIINIIVIISI